MWIYQFKIYLVSWFQLIMMSIPLNSPGAWIWIPGFALKLLWNRRAYELDTSDTTCLVAHVRCMSNALQQLHHSFNFYFFTGPSSHISNGCLGIFRMQHLGGSVWKYLNIQISSKLHRWIWMSKYFSINSESSLTVLLLKFAYHSWIRRMTRPGFTCIRSLRCSCFSSVFWGPGS